MTVYSIYILRSLKDGKSYTGYTKNLERRFQEHVTGRVKSTRNRRPLKLIYSETFNTKTEALIREKYLKTRQGRRELKTITST
ncbi:MAG: GIY-YIG nuclease family protein [Candidatus Gracilibacteria bacterium]|jgi:putative endonuclease